MATKRTVIGPTHPLMRYNLRAQRMRRANDWWVVEQTNNLGRFIGPYATEDEARVAISLLASRP